MSDPGWSIEERLADTRASSLAVGSLRPGGEAVLLKLAVSGSEEAFRREFELMRDLSSGGIARPLALLQDGTGLAMLLGPPGPRPLASRLDRDPVEWPRALGLALTAAHGLAALHAHGLVHRDLRPGNLLVDDRFEALVLADLSQAQPPGPAVDPQAMAWRFLDAERRAEWDHWAYLSPEQTGRTERHVDGRSDLYGLGILLHRLLAGRLPFDAEEPMEWVHCHLARVPPSLAAQGVEVPATVQSIVSRLLAKSPQDRYQTVAGLQFDIERCLAASRDGREPRFEVGTGDMAGRLDVAHRLFGRDEESALMARELHQALQGDHGRFLLVSGEPGTGKTALARQLRAEVLAAGARWAEGRYEPGHADVPYSAVLAALDTQVRRLLGAEEMEVAGWRARFAQELGVNAGLAVRLLPALAALLGSSTPPPPETPEAQRRLQLVVRQVFRLLCAGSPLVLFLDDLHAADSGSLALLEEALADRSSGTLLVAGTCRTRDGQLPAAVAALASRLRKEGVPVAHVDIGPWHVYHLAQVLGASLGCAPAEVRPLAGLIHRRTEGNPYFSLELLRDLRAEHAVWLDGRDGRWRWDPEAVSRKGVSGNVVELLVGRLRRLPLETLEIVKRAACVGSVVGTRLLAALAGPTAGRLTEVLAPAVEASLLLPLNGRIRFVHDRVRDAAYELIPVDDRPGMHLEAGRQLLKKLSPAEREERLFEIVQQWREGASLLHGEEAALASELFRRAGRKAKAASAFASARGHFHLALQLQPEDAWTSNREQALELSMELAECESVAGQPDVGERLLDEAMSHAETTAERLRVHRCRVRLRQACSRYPAALDCAIEGLRLSGIDIPDDEAALQKAFEADREALDALMHGRAAADLLGSPPLRDERVKEVVELLGDALFPARNCRPEVFPLLVVKAVTLAVQHGSSPSACQAYSMYPRLLRGEGRLREAYEFSRLSLQLAERLGAESLRGSLAFSHLAGSYFLRQPYASGLPLLHAGFTASLQSGTLYDAAGCALVMCEYLLECSSSVEEIVKTAEAYAPVLGGGASGLWPPMLQSWARFARALQGRTSGPEDFDGEGFTELAYQQALQKSQAVALQAIFLVLKQAAAALAGRHEASLRLADEAGALLRPLAGMAIEVTHRHYRALSRACLLESPHAQPDRQPPGAVAEQAALLAGLQRDQDSLRALSEACPANFRHRWLLVSAEIARARGEDAQAESHYAMAVEEAHRHGFLLHEAQALERAAAFQSGLGRHRVARALCREARDAYRQWGAEAKARALEREHPPLANGWSAGQGTASFDAATIAKATQALSGLMDVDRVIDVLMRLALGHAGAQVAMLFLADGAGLRWGASAEVDGSQVQVRLRPAAGSPAHAPSTLVNYVRRTREQVLLADTELPHPFLNDPYLQQVRPRSVMGLPLLHRTGLVGVLYLEHRLAAHAFSWNRVALLEMLASQAAVSLETARLYAALKEENAERRRAEQEALERQSRLQRLVESSLVGVRFADLEGRIFEANEAFLRIVGYSESDVAAGRLTLQSLTPPEHRDADARALEQLRRQGRYGPFEKEYLRRDGTRVPVLIGGVLFEGRRPQTVAFVLDLTESKRAESEHRARVVAEAASEAKSAFLASMSHELRTPLNGVLGYVQLLQRDASLTQKQRKGLETIESSGRHLLALINDILDLARIEAGRLDIAADPVDLGRLMQTVGDTIRPVAERKGLAFVVDVGGDAPLTVRADQRRLSQVLLNLLGNAVKFTDSGSVSLRLQAQPSAGPEPLARLRFEVADTGVGMDAEELGKIFLPFEQVGAAHRRNEGTGLGLAITEALVRRMGGRVDVGSEPGRGSVFTVQLQMPLLQQATAEASRGTISGYEGRRRTVLVAEDRAESRSFLVDLLGSLGFDTVEAADGARALLLARERRPDLILMDNEMPSLTGLEAIRRLQADPSLKDVPIVAVSAGATEVDRKRALQAGAKAFVTKPVDVEALLLQVGAALGLAWQRLPADAPPAQGGA